MKARLLSSLAGAFLVSALSLPAGSVITGVTLSTTNSPDSSTHGMTFGNEVAAITSFSTSTTTYTTDKFADAAYVRRSGTSGSNNSSVWYTGSGQTFTGVAETNYADLLLGNNIYSGSDNTFSNGTNSARLGNIERLDFVFTGGINAASNLAFSVWDRGTARAHDAFKIAVITGWDSKTNLPTSYATLTGMGQNWGNTTDPINASTYTIFRYNSGNNLGTSTAHSETGKQGLGGAVFTMADLGVAANTTIYGYSIFGYDVTDKGDTSNLLKWTDGSYFPSRTTGDNGTGGIDLASINGVLYTVQVPEPATYAAILGALVLGFIAYRRSRNR